MSHLVYIGLGSNLGDSKTHVLSAMTAIDQLPGTKIIQRSSLYQTEPIDADGSDYVNAVVAIQTVLSPEMLLSKLQFLEDQAKRERPYYHAPRTLDLDILLYDNQFIHRAALEIPHPRITKRAFVLIPLLEIEPSITIVGKGSAKDYVEKVKDQRIQKIAGTS